MATIDPQLFAAGIGALSGGYLMSSNNDPLSIGAGAAIGGGVGALGTFTLPSLENMLSATNKELPMPNPATSSLRMNEEKAKLISQANTIIDTSNAQFSGAFDPERPFSTLSGTNFENFSTLVNNTTNPTELRRIGLALTQHTDDVGININSIKLGPTQQVRNIIMSADSSESSREKAFKDYARNELGFAGREAQLHSYYLNFKPLLNRAEQATLSDGELLVPGLDNIKLSATIGTGANQISAHVSGNNVYNSTAVNLFGEAKLKKMSAEVTARALGIDMTDKFNKQALEEMLAGTEGVTPDRMIGMLSNAGLSDEKMNEVIETLNKKREYDSNLTGQYASSKRLDGIETTDYSRNTAGMTSFEHKLNFKADGSLDLNNPISKVSTTISGPSGMSEQQRLHRMITQEAGDYNRLGIKPEYTGVYRNSGYTSVVLNANTPAGRNVAAGSRNHTVTSSIDNSFNELVEKLGLHTQYGSSIAVPRLNVDVNKFNDIVPDILGADITIGDGFSLTNKEFTNKVSITENVKYDMHPDAKGNILLTNPVARDVLAGKPLVEQLEELKVHNLETLDDTAESKVIKERYRAMFAKPGDVVGYDHEGMAVKLGDQFSDYTLSGVDHITDGDHTRVQLTYSGTTQTGEQHVFKMFGVDAKTQGLNLDRDLFGKAAVLGSMINEGTLVKDGKGYRLHGEKLSRYDIRSLFNNKDKPLGDSLADLFAKRNKPLNKATTIALNQLVQQHSMGIGMISDIKDSGQHTIKTIADALFTDAPIADLNPTITKLITEQYTSGKGLNLAANRNLADALAKTAVTFSEDKATSSTVLAALMAHKENFDHLFKIRDKAAIIKQAAELGIQLPTGKFAKKNFIPLFDNYAASIVKTYSNRDSIVKVLNDKDAFAGLVPLFKNVGNTLPGMSYAFGSPDLRLEGVLGSATQNKTMSWNSQLQLKYSGLSNEDLDLFGSHNSGKISDIHAIFSMDTKSTKAINSQITPGNIEGVKRAIASSSDQRRQALKEVGITIADSYGTYTLNHSVNGIKSIPIPLENTAIFNSYISNKTGEMMNPKAISTIGKIIDLDARHGSAKTIQEKKATQALLETELKSLATQMSRHLFSTNPLHKTAMGRESERSVYSNVNPVGGLIDKFTTALEAEGQSTSYAAVSQTGAMERLRAAGLKVKDHADMMKNYTEDHTVDGVTVKRLKTPNSPFFSVMTREPSTGPGSTRMLQYIVDSSIAKDSSALHISPKNDLYKLLQLGDYDGDHVPEFFPDFSKDVTPTFNKLQGINEELERVKGYAANLGVKGKNNTLPSIMDVFDKNPTLNYNDTMDRYVQTLFSKSDQTAVSKRIAAPATKLAAGINNSIALVGIEDASRTTAARVVSHYLVENLIKTKHIDPDKFLRDNGVTDIERLYTLREKYKNNVDVKREYLPSLRKHLTEMLGANASPEHQKIHAQAIEDIVHAEKVHVTASPINTMEANVLKGKPLVDQISGLRDILTGRNSASAVLNTINAEVTPLADKARMGYDILKSSINKNIEANKKVLGIGMGALALTALMTQKAPDFSRNDTRADPSRMTMEPARDHQADQQNDARQHVDGFDLHRATDYILPPQQQKYAMGVQGNYIGNRGSFNNNIKTSVFGDNIDTVRVETY